MRRRGRAERQSMSKRTNEAAAQPIVEPIVAELKEIKKGLSVIAEFLKQLNENTNE
jgi:hypothetical protein